MSRFTLSVLAAFLVGGALVCSAPVGAQDPTARHDAAPTGPQSAEAPAAALVALEGRVDLEPLRRLSALDGGRLKPLDTLARERVKLIVGDGAFRGQDPLYTLFSMVFEREAWTATEALKVRNLKLVNLFAKEKNRALLSPREVDMHEGFQALKRKLQDTGGPFGPNENAALELAGRRDHLAAIRATLPLVPIPGADASTPWASPFSKTALAAPLTQTLAERLGALESAWRSGNAEGATRAAAALAETLAAAQQGHALGDTQIVLELGLNHYHPFRLAWVSLIAAALLLGGVALSGARAGYIPGAVALWCGMLLAGAGLAARTIIVERAPVANLYEATIFATFAAVLAGAAFEAAHRNGLFGAAASVFGALAFMLGDLSPNMDKEISPLNPVLLSYWLNIHVTCMLLSYGVFAVAFLLGVFYFGKYFPARGYPKWSIAMPVAICVAGVAVLYQPRLELQIPTIWHYMAAMVIAPLCAVGFGYGWLRLTGGGHEPTAEASKALEEIEKTMYRAVQVGFLLITTGVILGAVWANESWGRYWGWDPKETWAFITLVVYGVYIHGRFAGWFRGPRAALFGIGGFYSVLFTFYGVSFVLEGLHSYLAK